MVEVSIFRRQRRLSDRERHILTLEDGALFITVEFKEESAVAIKELGRFHCLSLANFPGCWEVFGVPGKETGNDEQERSATELERAPEFGSVNPESPTTIPPESNSET